MVLASDEKTSQVKEEGPFNDVEIICWFTKLQDEVTTWITSSKMHMLFRE